MEIQQMLELSPIALVLVPVIVGLVQVAKVMGLPNWLSPVTAIVLAMILMAITAEAWQVAVLQGIVVGLTASGLYSGTKATIKG